MPETAPGPNPIDQANLLVGQLPPELAAIAHDAVNAPGAQVSVEMSGQRVAEQDPARIAATKKLGHAVLMTGGLVTAGAEVLSNDTARNIGVTLGAGAVAAGSFMAATGRMPFARKRS